MADIDRMNQLIGHALHGRREECKDDEERRIYDSIVKDIRMSEKWGVGIGVVNEISNNE
jgi:hypothetical protein